MKLEEDVATMAEMEGTSNTVNEVVDWAAPGLESAAPPDAPHGAVAQKLSYPARLLKSFYSANWRDETKELLILVWPVVLTNILIFLPGLISFIFAGTKGYVYGTNGYKISNAIVLALTFVNLAGTSVGMGLTTAYDTLLSQTFGGDNKKRVGIILQRGILIIMLFCFPCWALYMNSEGVILRLVEALNPSKLSANYIVIFIFGLPGFILFQILAKYLQNQNMVQPPMVVAVLLNLVNAVYNAIFLVGLNMGTSGAAVSLGLSYWTACAILLFWIWFRGLHKDTWGGVSIEALQEWGTFTKLAILGWLTVALESWNYEIGTLAARLLSMKPVVVQELMSQFINLALMVPFGVSIGASIRIGQLLGGGQPERAKAASRLSILFTFFTGIFVFSIYAGFRNFIPKLFMADKWVIDKCSTLYTLVGITAFMDSFQAVCSGILRGCGRQRIGAGVNLVGFYVIGLPIGLALMLKTRYGVEGFWIGTVLGATFRAVVLNIVVAFTNWELESEQAKVRAGVKKRGIQELERAPTFFQKEGEAVTMEKDIPVITHTDPTTSVTSGDITSDTEVIIESDSEAVLAMKRLPMSKLILRRGLTLLAMILVLVVGLILRFTIKLPRL